MLYYNYLLRSWVSYASTITWPPPVSLLDKNAKLLCTTLDCYGGICSLQPPPRKICATAGATTVINPDYDLFSFSNLTELEDSDALTGLVPQSAAKKCK